MFGKPKEPAAPPEREPIDHGLAEYEYAAFTYVTAEGWNKEVNQLARQGWELVNGDREGVAIYAFMRRKIGRGDDAR